MHLEVEDLKITIDDDKAIISGSVEKQIIKEKVALLVGNTAGIGEVDNQIIVQTEEEKEIAESQFYTIESGDTLGKIAKKFYGNPMKYTEIFEANKPMLKNPDSIYPGQVLRIPPLD